MTKPAKVRGQRASDLPPDEGRERSPHGLHTISMRPPFNFFRVKTNIASTCVMTRIP